MQYIPLGLGLVVPYFSEKVNYPDLIILDEPVSALDVFIRAQLANLLCDIQDEFGISYLLITHDLAFVKHLSNRIGVMYLGKLVEMAENVKEHLSA